MDRLIRHSKLALRDWYDITTESMGWREGPEPRAAAAALPSAEEWDRLGFGACWIGHATVLLRTGGRTILTDPHFRERSGFKFGKRMIGRMRSTELPGDVHELPRVDVVLLSHAHLDHWDKPTLKRLAQSETTAVIPRGTKRLLPKGFGDVVEMAWEDSAQVGDAHLTALQPQHWGARWLVDGRRGYNAYVIEADGKRILFGGDTGPTNAFDHLSNIDLAIFGIGNSYEPYDRHHASPEQVAEMAGRCGAARLLPVHHSTFRASREPIDEPLERLKRAYAPERIVCERVGEVWQAE